MTKPAPWDATMVCHCADQLKTMPICPEGVKESSSSAQGAWEHKALLCTPKTSSTFPRVGFMKQKVASWTHLQESITKTTSLMVMLVSAILVDKITYKKQEMQNDVIWSEKADNAQQDKWQNLFKKSAIHSPKAQENWAQRRLHTLVTPGGTGSNTLRCSSRGIWECRGKILYWWPPTKGIQEGW